MMDFSDLETLEEVVYQAVGAASVCWSDMSNTGVFDDEKARAVAEGALARIRELTVVKE